jgi:hypothetical protein
MSFLQFSRSTFLLNLATMTPIITILIRPTLLLCQPLLLIRFFTLLTPLGSLIFTCIFLFITLFLGLVYGLRVVFGG